MIEINGNPNRRDLSDRHARLAADAGVRIVLNTDSHGVDTLGNMVYAVATARRAWLTKADVANTRPWAEFKKLRKR
jgi:DNA polymerase (family 10)